MYYKEMIQKCFASVFLYHKKYCSIAELMLLLVYNRDQIKYLCISAVTDRNHKIQREL